MENKKWYQSKTIWGIAIAFLGFVLNNIFNVTDLNLPENADYATIMQHYEAVKAAKNNMAVLISELLSIVGTVIAIVGRVKADQKIKA